MSKLIRLLNGGFTIVDDEDYLWISKYRWYCLNGYAVRYDKGRAILMHCEIMNPPKDKEVDHREGRRWDNRKESLRLCIRSENCRNQIVRTFFNGKLKSSKYKGVTRWGAKWKAQIVVDSEVIYLGVHNSDSLAAIAYNKAALLYFGDFASLNSIDEVRQGEIEYGKV